MVTIRIPIEPRRRWRRPMAVDWYATIRAHMPFSQVPFALVEDLEQTERERRIADDEARWLTLASTED